MDGLVYVAILGIIVVSGIILMMAASDRGKHLRRGRVVVGVIAFFIPALFVAYLVLAGYLRNEFHRDRLEASNFGGECTLPLGNGYKLRFFDEWPSMATIGVGVLERVRSIAIAGQTVFGETGRSNSSDGPTDFFFSLNLSSGEIKKFDDEAALRAHSSEFGRLIGTDEAFRDAENRQRSIFFWPLVAGGPIALFAGGLFWIRRRWDWRAV